MKSTDNTSLGARARGDVVLSFVSGNAMFPVVARHNTLSYSASDAVAAAYGGDSSMIPRFIGFIYGESSYPTDLASVSDRNMKWDDLKDEMAKIHGNVLISQFSSTPSISVTDPGPDSTDNEVQSEYSGNSVTFKAVTRSGSAGNYAFDTSEESGFAGEFDDGKYLYHAVLLGYERSPRCQDEKKYSILGRVSLAKGGTFRKKPADYELALDWKVTFF